MFIIKLIKSNFIINIKYEEKRPPCLVETPYKHSISLVRSQPYQSLILVCFGLVSACFGPF